MLLWEHVEEIAYEGKLKEVFFWNLSWEAKFLSPTIMKVLYVYASAH